jgi:protein TonB
VFEVLNVVENNKEIAEEEEIESTEASTEAITGPSGPVHTGPVVTGPVTAVEEETDEGQIFQVVEQMPEFPGGMEALMKYLQKNIKYPSRAQDNNVQGRVMVTFVVNKDGSIVDPEVIKAVDKDLDNEALRVVKAMPKWNPGKQRGKPVRVKYTVPVTFRLQ